jgi:hypothetical protein
MRAWQFIKAVVLCHLMHRHRWRYRTTTPEAGKVFVCLDCGIVRGDRCGIMSKP